MRQNTIYCNLWPDISSYIYTFTIAYSAAAHMEQQIKFLLQKGHMNILEDQKATAVFIRFSALGRLSKFEVLKGALNRDGH